MRFMLTMLLCHRPSGDEVYVNNVTMSQRPSGSEVYVNNVTMSHRPSGDEVTDRSHSLFSVGWP